MLCIWASFFLVSSLPRHLLYVRWDVGHLSLSKEGFCLGVVVLSSGTGNKHIWTRKTNTNFSRQPSCTHNWHSPVFLPPLLPPQDICWNCSGSDQTPSKPNTAWHMQVSTSKRRSKCIDTSASLFSQLGVIFFFILCAKRHIWQCFLLWFHLFGSKAT